MYGVSLYNIASIWSVWLKVDASRRRNDPHKQPKGCEHGVQLRCKSCPVKPRGGSSGSLGLMGEPSSMASVGAKTRSAVCGHMRFFLMCFSFIHLYIKKSIENHYLWESYYTLML